MPASIESLTIKGIRSYGAHSYQAQTIDFYPLTLIVGANGSGKTTIIEALKFIISGDEPPLSESRRNFIHMGGEPVIKVDSKTGPYAYIKLRFTTSRGESCVATREILKPATKNATPSILSNFRIGTRPLVQINKQDDWPKTVPKLFNLPNQALLNNVILCHQENSLWCMGDSSSVKQVFDKIFGCEQYKREIKNVDAELKNFKTELALGEKDLIFLSEKLEQFKKLEEDLKRTHSEIDDLELKIKDLDGQINSSTEKRRRIEDEISKSRQDTSELEEKLLSESQALSRKLSDAQANCQGLVQRIKMKENFVRKLVDQLEHTSPIGKDLAKVTDNLGQMSIICETIVDKPQSSRLKELIEDSKGIVEDVMVKFNTGNIAKIKADLAKERSEIETSKTLLKTSEASRDELKSTYTQAQEEHAKLRATIKENESNSNLKELKQIESKLIDLRDIRSRMKGTQNQMTRDISRINYELDQLSKTKSKYAESLGKVNCSKIIISDLEKLKECFQQSIITFHDQMILKINEVLKVRWRQIYQGKDIERIELVDEEVTKSKNQKSYNYYIAMRKGGVRMKMREKSSAGQRALASIILRMTLAELFVKDFAFIALDEPTASLDEANVKALAKSIGIYVKMRAKLGTNIQWIIITHDESFLKALDQECSPYYYRIELDQQGCSKINKISALGMSQLNSQEDSQDYL